MLQLFKVKELRSDPDLLPTKFLKEVSEEKTTAHEKYRHL